MTEASVTDEVRQELDRFRADFELAPPRSRQGDRRPCRDRRRHADRPDRRRARAARGRPRPGKDAAGAHAGRRPAPEVPAHPVHARPHAGRPDRHQRRARNARGRSPVRVPARAGLRQPRPGRRDQPRHAQDPVGPARGDAGAVGHGRRQDAHPGAVRSSCWRPRTRSRWKAPTRSPRPSSTASSSSCWSSSRPPRRWRRSSTARPRRPSPAREPVFDGQRIVELSHLARQIPIADELRRYGVALVLATHPEHALASEMTRRYVRYGSSPRGAQAHHPGRQDPGHPRPPLPRRPRRPARQSPTPPCGTG